MRRRSRRGPNNSESTGKVGQELPTGKMAPLRPAYMDAEPMNAEAVRDRAARPQQAPHSQVKSQPPARPIEPNYPDPAEDADLEDAEGDAYGDPADEAIDDSAEDAGRATPVGKVEIETQPEALNTPPIEHASVKPRTPKGYVVLAIGLPGSGKTTWFKRRSVSPLSSDMLRSILFDDIDEQRYQKLVFSTLRSLLRARLIAKMPWNYVDATNLSPHERRQWIKMAKSFGYDVQAVFFDVPLEVCLERNQRRERSVNDEVLRRMAERLRPPHFKEGFSKITLVRVKAKEEPAA